MDEAIKLTGVSASLFVASWCNLDCTYCNIPKHNKLISEQHQKIIEDIVAVTPFIDRLTLLFGDRLESISHWGSEPTLTLGYFRDFYAKAVEVFPNLKDISLSSNFMTNPEVISNFILRDLPQEKRLTLSIQMSLDGEEKITEVNRGKGTTEVIQNHIVKFIENLNVADSIPHEVELCFKSTMNKDQYQDLINEDNMAKHYQFFDNLIERMDQANKNGNVRFATGVDPTMVCPDKYTKEDGINLSLFYDKVRELRERKLFKYVVPSLVSYSEAYRKLLKFKDELFTKASMFTCSAGDTQFGVSEYLHPCHDTFYLPYDEVQDAIRADQGRINASREAENVDSGRTSMAAATMTKSINGLTQHEADKYQYLQRGFHDFTKFKNSYGVASILAMANCGQVSECYKDPEFAILLSMMASMRHSCPTGNIQYSGSLLLTDMAFFKLFGNGLLESFIKEGLE